MAEFENIKGLKLPGIEPTGNFPSKHPQFINVNGKNAINPDWNKDQAILRSQAKDLANIQHQNNLRDAGQHERNMRSPEKQKPFKLPAGTKLPGVLGYPGMIMQFMDFYKQQQPATTTPNGTPLQTNLDLQSLRNLKLS